MQDDKPFNIEMEVSLDPDQILAESPGLIKHRLATVAINSLVEIARTSSVRLATGTAGEGEISAEAALVLKSPLGGDQVMEFSLLNQMAQVTKKEE